MNLNVERTLNEFLAVLPEEYQHGARLLWDYLYPLSEAWQRRLDVAYSLRHEGDTTGWESAGSDLWFILDQLHPGEMPPLDGHWTAQVVPWVTGGMVAALDLDLPS